MTEIADLARRLRPLVFRLYYVVRRQSPQLRLTLTQGFVMATLSEHGRMRMSALAALEGVRLASMSDVVARLERHGCVRRRPDPTDARATVVEITAAGQALVDGVVADREAFLVSRLRRLDAAERAAIERALPALQRLLAEEE